MTNRIQNFYIIFSNKIRLNQVCLAFDVRSTLQKAPAFKGGFREKQAQFDFSFNIPENKRNAENVTTTKELYHIYLSRLGEEELLNEALKFVRVYVSRRKIYDLIKRFGNSYIVLTMIQEESSNILPLTRLQRKRLDIFLGISKRAHSNLDVRQPVTSKTALMEYIRIRYSYNRIQLVVLIAVSLSSRIICEEIILRGTVTYVQLHVQKVVNRLVELDAAGAFLFRTQPSGNVAPTEQDYAFVRELRYALEILDIKLLDFTVVNQETTYSLAARSLR